MSITRARAHVQRSRSRIENQIQLLAREAGVDVKTMAQALQEGLTKELEQEDDEFPCEVHLEVSGTVDFIANSENEIKQKIAELKRQAATVGVKSFLAEEV